MYVDGTAFRTAISDLLTGAITEVLGKINEIVASFNQKAQNASIDYNQTISTTDEATSFSSYVNDYSSKLSTSIDTVLSAIEDLVNSHAFDRPLLRHTGNRKSPLSITLDGINTFSREFKNVGNKSWSGWMTINATDKYKNSVSVDVAPSNISTIEPGETSWLTREIEIPKVRYVSGSPRSWGHPTTIQTGIYTRNV
jgi:hypothetical protein